MNVTVFHVVMGLVLINRALSLAPALLAISLMGNNALVCKPAFIILCIVRSVYRIHLCYEISVRKIFVLKKIS